MSCKQPNWAGFVCMILWTAVALSTEQPDSSVSPKSNSTVVDNQPPYPAEDIKFFEAKIRPVLVEQCYSCHSETASKANKLKGGLRVDSRDGLLKGGDSGPAIDLKKPEKSLLLEAIRYESLQMPPQGKLPASVVADFEQWVSRGLADPRTIEGGGTPKREIDLVAGRQHWAYRVIDKGSLAKIDKVSSESTSPVDTFILSKLSEVGLDAAKAAEKSVLVRRIYFDVVGLPPTPAEIDEFLADDSPDAFERLVDRLLASPHFGERWGRHWLSVARFGESITLRGTLLPQAWRYRDYVIDFFNSDRSFAEFIVEQLAGDLLPADSLEQRQRQRIATSYLVLGNINPEEQDKKQLQMDVVDEQLDAISKGFLAQTITCARCHDHKFDPIPTHDYYAIAGILANVKTLEHENVSRWLELPLPLEPDREAVFAQHEAQISDLKSKVTSTQEAIRLLADKNSPKSALPKIIAAKDLPGVVVDDLQAKIVGEWQKSQNSKSYVGNGYIHDQNSGKGSKTVTLLPELPKEGRYEVRLAYTPGDNRCAAVPVTVFSADGERTILVNEKLPPPIDDHFISLGQFRFELNGQGFVIVSNEGTQGHVIVDAVQFLPVELLTSPAPPAEKNPASAATDNSDPAKESQLKEELKSLQQQLDQLQKNGPHRPMYVSVQERKQISDISIHVRGSVHTLGEKVPRGFLQVVPVSQFSVPTEAQSGRKELGEWIASSENPLTSRVVANRVWYWLFGNGLVGTPDNFGTTGEAPSHPELLDHLAGRLLDSDWSVKQLIREIVYSQTYRQSSTVLPRLLGVDPENRWLSHQNRRRQDSECLLDAILSINGQLQTEMGGNTIRAGTSEDYGYQHRTSRRAVYWPVLRNSLPEIFEVFDFADPSTPTSVRHNSTVAPQALFALNDKWISEQAKIASQRLLNDSLPDDAARIRHVFQSTLGRLPTPNEMKLSVESLIGLSPDDAWANLFQALFATIDFRYVE